MSHEDLGAIFVEPAEDLSPPRLVSAPAQVNRVRRRRRAMAAAAVAVLVISVGVLAMSRPMSSSSPRSRPTADPTIAGSARVVRFPATVEADAHARPYWPESADPPANAPTLADAPLSHAVLLYSPYSADHGSDGVAPIYAYGEGSINGGSGTGLFHWVRLEANLSNTRDGGGNSTNPLDPNSLAPMGRAAAFAQPDAVVVVDLRTGASKRIGLPGLHEDVSWLPDGRHLLVSTDSRTWLVDSDTGSAVPTAVSGQAVTPLTGGGTGLTTLSLSSASKGPVVRSYDDAGLAAGGSVAVDTESAMPYHISYLNLKGWRYANFIAQGANGKLGSASRDFVVVIDTHTGAVSDVLDVGTGRAKGCCAVVGWENSDNVLLHIDREGLLSWKLSTGVVTRLTDSIDGMISVASTGCDWTITIADITATCMS